MRRRMRRGSAGIGVIAHFKRAADENAGGGLVESCVDRSVEAKGETPGLVGEDAAWQGAQF